MAKSKRFRPEELDHIISRIVNETGSAEGSLLPPRQIGPGRVPAVSNLRFLRRQRYFGSTQFTLAWDEPTTVPTQQISHFNVYVFGLMTNNAQAIGPYTTTRSPVELLVRSQTAVPVTFVVQTVLKNGQLSTISLSPTVSHFTLAGSLTAEDYPDGTIPLTALENGTDGQIITWDSAGVITTIGPGALDTILTGQGAGVVPAFQTLTQVSAQTTNFTAASTGLFRLYLCNCSSGAITATLPTLTSAAGRVYSFKKTDVSGNTLTIDGNGSETIDGALTLIITSQYDNAIIVPGPTEWSIV